MNKQLPALIFEGIRSDSLGNYLVGLGLLAALSSKWSGVNGLASEEVGARVVL